MSKNTTKTTNIKEERGARALFSNIWFALNNIFKESSELESDEDLKNLLENSEIDEKSKQELLATAKACNNATVSGMSNSNDKNEKYTNKIKVEDQQKIITQHEPTKDINNLNRNQEHERN